MPELPAPKTVLKVFQKNPAKIFSLRELTSKFHLRSSQARSFRSLLKDMARRRLIVPLKKSRYRAAAHSGRMPKKPSAKMAAAGKASSSRPRADLILGRLVTHRDGYGFVIPDQRLKETDQDIYIPVRGIGSALHGDRVAVAAGPARGDRVQGRIVEVVERLQKTVVGQFRSGHPENFVIPFEQRIPSIIIPRGKEMPPQEAPRSSPHRQFGGESKGQGKRRAGSHREIVAAMEDMVVDVEMTEYPRPGVAPRGRVVEVLGRREDFGIDVEITIRKYHLPHRFPEEVLEEAQEASSTVGPEDRRGRKDFRGLPVVTIDGETAKDFDDAVYVERSGHGGYRLDVHIADVVHYVRPDTPIDREARLRGTSVYFPDRAVPMLPLELSNGICSLNPQTDRLALSVSMEIDSEGSVRSYELTQGVIHSAARMTYTDVQAVLDGDKSVWNRYRKLAPQFELMKELALILNRKRERRGSIDFDLPEPEIEFDEQGLMTGIKRAERLMAHRIIEEFMLMANETVARFLTGCGVALLHRVHEKPDAKKVLEFEEVAAGFGYTLGIVLPAARRFDLGTKSPRDRRRHIHYEVKEEDLKITPFHYQKLAQKIAGRPEERIVSYLMLRSLKQARYLEESLGHFALGTKDYTHFTSPIRRYPDLVVHRILKAVLGRTGGTARASGEETKKGPPPGKSAKKSGAKFQSHSGSGDGGREIPAAELRNLATETSASERRAQEAERELMNWKKAAFMSKRLGEEFDALVISLSRFGFNVELLDLFVEGMVPMANLDGDRFAYRERARAIVGERSGKAIRMGDRVRVRLDRIDRLTNRLEFSPLEGGTL